MGTMNDVHNNGTMRGNVHNNENYLQRNDRNAKSYYSCSHKHWFSPVYQGVMMFKVVVDPATSSQVTLSGTMGS